MHRSRLTALVIDCQTDDLEAAAQFWGKALGKKVLPMDPQFPTYRELETTPDELKILVQQVTHESRVHIDIETDDKDAEVKRLQALGATNPRFVKRWYVLDAPSGHHFCVVNPQRGPIEGKGNAWD
jgi:hypothetical protein